MKKTTTLFVLPALLILATAGTAHAQYYRYSSGKPSVEINMDILDSINPDIQWDHGGSRVPTPSPIPLPVTEAPLDAPTDTTPSTITDTTADAAPTNVPSPTRILKPMATAMSATPTSVSAQAPAKTYTPSPIVQNMMKSPAAPVSAAIAPAPVAPAVTPAPIPPVAKASAVTAVPKASDTPKKSEAAPVEKEEAVVDISEEVSAKKSPPAAPAPEEASTPPSPAVPSMADLSLNFDSSANEITEQHKHQLQAVIAHLNQSPDTRLQIRAYAMGEDGSKSSARRISLSRALSIRSYLMDMQIKPTRVDVRALGTETDRTPVDRVDLVFVR